MRPTEGPPPPQPIVLALNEASPTGTGAAGESVEVRGWFSPGHSPGIETFGDLTLFESAYLLMEIGGLIPGLEYDQIVVSGHLTLSGTLEVVLINGFTPEAGNSFDLFDWGTLSGEFSTVLLPALSSDLAWDATELYVSGVLQVVGGSFEDRLALDVVTVADAITATVAGPGSLWLFGAGLALALIRRRLPSS